MVKAKDQPRHEGTEMKTKPKTYSLPKTSNLSKLLNTSALDEDTVLEYAAMCAWLREASINDKQLLFDRKDDVYGSYMDTYIMCKVLEQQRQEKDHPKSKSYKKTVV